MFAMNVGLLTVAIIFLVARYVKVASYHTGKQPMHFMRGAINIDIAWVCLNVWYRRIPWFIIFFNRVVIFSGQRHIVGSFQTILASEM